MQGAGKNKNVLSYEKIIFRVTEQSEDVFELDITENDIFIPKNGIFASIQILGYTDKQGKLLPNKKYQEVKTRKGIVKVSTTFRPLLPFTNKIPAKRTFIKRIFLNNNEWVRYEKKNIPRSKLLAEGLNNYGMGLKMKVYQIYCQKKNFYLELLLVEPLNTLQLLTLYQVYLFQEMILKNCSLKNFLKII